MSPDESRSPQDEPNTRCPFGWCTEPHIDDWLSNENDDPFRSHTVTLPDAERTGFGHSAPYLLVYEARTKDGVTYSPALVHYDDYEPPLCVDHFADRLAILLAHLPDWSAAARATDEIRAARGRS